MSKETQNRLDQKDQLLQAILPHVGFDGWTDTAIESGARDLGVDQEGFRIIANTGTYGGQEVPHFHVHICGGQKLGRMIEKK